MDFPGFAESPTTLSEQLWFIHFMLWQYQIAAGQSESISLSIFIR